MKVNPTPMPNQEPLGCKPCTHWEERVLEMEYMLQNLVETVGLEVPSARSQLLTLAEYWTKQRDEIRQRWKLNL